MEWTAERDGQLKELHAKRVSASFIASWMRWPPSAVRARMVELGMVKPPTAKATAITTAAAARTSEAKSAAPLRMVDALSDMLEDETELRTNPGCPRGHLMPEAKIAALYRAAGTSYR